MAGCVAIILAAATAVNSDSAQLIQQPSAEAFGYSFASTADSLVFGSEDHVYLYQRGEDRWELEAQLALPDGTPGNHHFFALTDEWCFLASPSANDGEGVVYVLEPVDNGQWEVVQQIELSDDAPSRRSFGGLVVAHGDNALIRSRTADGRDVTFSRLTLSDSHWRHRGYYYAPDSGSRVSLALNDDEAWFGHYASEPPNLFRWNLQHGEEGQMHDGEPITFSAQHDAQLVAVDVDGHDAVVFAHSQIIEQSALFFEWHDGQWQHTQTLSLPFQKAPWLSTIDLQSGTAVFAVWDNGLVVASKNNDGEWEQVAHVPVTDAVDYGRGSVGLTSEHIVFALGLVTEPGPRTFVSVPLNNVDDLSHYIWGRRSNGQWIGTMSRDAIKEALRDIAKERYKVRQQNDTEADALLAAEFQLLLTRMRWLTDEE